jgi:hypothetical protein
VTSLTITRVEITGEPDKTPRELPENATLTQPRSEREIRHAIGDVVARADAAYAIDLITMLQVKVRLAEGAGQRLSLVEFAQRAGYDLAQLRAE